MLIPPSTGGPIRVRLWRRNHHHAVVSVRDEGIGVPDDLENTKKDQLGMRLIARLFKQAGAEWRIERHAPGSEFILKDLRRT